MTERDIALDLYNSFKGGRKSTPQKVQPEKGQLLIVVAKEAKDTVVKKVINNDKVSGYIKNILNKIDFEKESYLVI